MNRKLSWTLCLLIIICIAMPPAIHAQSNHPDDIKSLGLANKGGNDHHLEVVKELVEERGPNYKKYLLRNGSYKLEIHESVIHYKDEAGKYQNINTSLVDVAGITDSIVPVSKDAAVMKNKMKRMKPDKTTGSFTSFHVPFYSEFPKKIVNGYSIQNGGEGLTFIPVGASANSVGHIDSKDKSKMTYQNVWPHTDIELQMRNDGIKENIVLRDEDSPDILSFQVEGPIISDHFFIQSPWIKDANGVIRDVKTTKRTIGSKQYIDYTWDKEGLVYPMIIDPIVSVQSSHVGCVNQYYATYICSSSNLQVAYKHQVGSDKIYGNTFRSFIHFNIPQIRDVSYTGATLRLNQRQSSSYSGSGGPTLSVKPYALAAAWPANWQGASWPGPKLYESQNISGTYDISLFNTGPSRSVQFDLTGILNYDLNNDRSSVSVALVATGMSVPSSIPDKEYFLDFYDPTLNLIYTDVAPPTIPRHLKVTAVTNHSVSLSWDPSVDNAGMVFYQIIKNGVNSSTYYTNSFTASGLEQNTKYTFAIRAFDTSSNLSLESNPVTVTTGSSKPIANFLNLSENGTYLSPLTVQWSYFDPTGQSLTAYELKGSTDHWATIGYDTGFVAATTPVDFTVRLSSSTPWSLAIRAHNGSVAGDWVYINNIQLENNIKYNYDQAGRLQSVTNVDTGELLLTYVYDRNGNLIKIVRP